MATTRVIIDGTPYRVKIVNGALQWHPRSVVYFPPQVSQEDVTEAQLPTDKRPSITIRNLSEGYGQDEQPLDGPIRKFDRVGDATGEGVDASLTPSGPILLAPGLFSTVLSSGTGPAGVRVLQYGTSGARAFAGTDVYTLPAWEATDIGDLGLTLSGQPVAFRGTQPTEHWYAPGGTGDVPRYSTDQGANWADITTTGGVTEMLDAAVIDGEVVYLYPGNYGTALRRFQDGGTNPTAYGTIDPVTTQASVATRILNWNDRAVIISNQEVLLLARDKSELTQNLLPEVTFSGDQVYPSGCHVWRGILWVPSTRGLFAVAADGSHQIASPESSDLASMAGSGAIGKGGAGIGHKGIIQAVAGDGVNLYGVLTWEQGQGAASTNGWLFKANVTVSGGQLASIAWFPLTCLGLVTNCNGMAVARHLTGTFNGVPTKSLLFSVYRYNIGSFSNEATYLIRLPNAGRDPRQDSNYRYALNGTLYPSRLNARFMAFSKDWLSLLPRTADLGYGVDQQTAVIGLGVQVRYKADSVPLTANSPYGYSTTTTQGAPETTGARIDLSGVRARGLDLAVRFSTSSAFSNQSPQLNAITADYRPAPAAIWEHTFTLEFSPGSYADDGGAGYGDPVTPDVALHKLMTLPNNAPFNVVLPDGREAVCFCPPGGVDPKITGVPDASYGNDGALPLDISLLLVEASPVTPMER